ncbi:MAG: toxic anion resistance protein [Bacillus sp. (in: Bacteria)]|uniref:Tellurite resistance protein n=1 Tax=Bacillus paralicheniformis TaxID=1648923 RepID=A0A7Z0WXL4_9BACI|nr:MULTISPECIES: toxic anion resistance protein [Bacillus]MBC8625162.1 toxic anion resistance protein [Robertmurraya crescens]MBL7478194.1 toxic anion resistance protein [Bacillus paralicheniformis]MBW4884903.1 toxic anion resistance protein [Bacillus sp. (in: firmicutes)]MCW4364262.1 toxic anion resistance protein [Bacillus paralicheniformis]MDU0416278.1 toxic anion resistance protein [Bacillus paralicheniformis]
MSEYKPSLHKTGAQLKIDDLLSDPFGQGEKSVSGMEEEHRGQQVNLVDTLSEEKRRQAFQLAEQIDPKQHDSMTLYGTQAQSKLLNFSHEMLEHVQKKDIGEIGQVLSDLMKKLEQVSPDELKTEKRNFFSRFFGRVSHSVQEVLSRYQKTGAQIDRISVKLEHSKSTLINDNKMLERLYEKNKEYYEALNVYIAAGQLKLEELKHQTIPELKEKSKTEHHHMAVQDVNDMIQFADRLEKRVYDLTLSRQITLQSAPQIRLIQHTNQVLAEKIQSSIMTAIPLWKNQVAIALTLLRQRRAVEAQKKVSATTNELLLKNAEMLKANTIETAKENERGFIDIETLKQVQDNLIGTLEETLKIQEEGRSKRLQAEEEIRAMEDDLKAKLLDMKENQNRLS